MGILDAPALKRPQVGTLTVFAHSFGDGVTGPSKRRNRWSTQLAKLLGASEENYSRNGSLMVLNTDEIVTRTHQIVVPLTNIVTSNKEYKAPIECGVIWGGINDAAVAAIVTGGYKTVTGGLRAALCRMRMEALFEQNHSSVVFATGSGGSGWTANVGTSLLSGTSATQNGANGNTCTIQTSANFPGGEVDIAALVPTGGGCVYTVTVDGVAAASWDTRSGGGTWEASSYRLTGLAAGNRTIVLTVTSRQGSGDYIDHWGWASADPGLLLVPNAPRMPFYPFIDHSPTDAEVLTMNGLIQGVCNEFDSRVIYVDIDAAFQANGGSALAFSDGIHPNDAGHAVAAETFYDAAVRHWPTKTTLSKAVGTAPDAQHALRLREQSTTTGKKDNRMGAAVLVGGTVTVTNRIVTANSRIFLTRSTTGGTVGHLSYTISAGTSFTINSSSGTDTSTINWMIIEAVPA